MRKFFLMQKRADRRRGIIVVYYFIFDERGDGMILSDFQRRAFC